MPSIRPGRRAVGVALEPGGDQRVDAEGRGDRRGDEVVGRRDEGDPVAALAVRLDQRLRLRPQRRRDDLAHEALARRRASSAALRSRSGAVAKAM